MDNISKLPAYNKKLTSLILASLVAGAGVCLATEARAADDKPLKGPIVHSTWGGDWLAAEKKYFAEPFTKETGIEVILEPSGTSPTIPAILQVEAGDVAIDTVASPDVIQLTSRDALAEFPAELQKIIAEHSREGTYTPYQLAIGSTGTVIACNTALVEKCPTTPTEFWDVENFPGTRAIRNRPFEVMAFAVQADGVPMNEIYPLDIERATRKIQEIKPHIKVWPAGITQEMQAITGEEVGIILTASGIAYRAKRQVPTLDVSWKGSVRTSSDGYVVLKDAPHKEAAFKYIEWVASHPQAQAEWTKAILYPSPTKELENLVEPEVFDGLTAAHMDEGVPRDAAWEIENTRAVQKAWQEVTTGK